MKKTLLSVLLSVAAFNASGASFDCTKAKSKAEVLICGVPELSAKDDEMAVLYSKAKSASKDKQDFSQKNKIEWKKREGCSDVDCLLNWYESRKHQLEMVISENSEGKPDQADRETYERAKRQLEAALKDPEKVKILECMGVKVYEDPQPIGHPPSPEECEIINKANGLE
ncbi:lysozyme inhibitor LprI family protein [Serratia fonticola]